MTLESRAKFGKYLVWLGLLAWVPYILARALQVELTVIPFLAAHLTGVLGGIWMRRGGERPAAPTKREKFLKQFSTILILLGVSAWAAYFGLEWITGVEREIKPFLIVHLSGVLSGAGIKVYNFLARQNNSIN